MARGDPLIPSIVRHLLVALPIALASVVACAQDADSAPSPGQDAASAPPKDLRRCGWLATHDGETALSDRDSSWLLARPGVHEAAGAWRPAFAATQTVATPDGVTACACMVVRADPLTHRVLAARDAQPRPLAACRNDAILRPDAPPRGQRKTVHGPGFSLSVPAGWRESRAGDCMILDDPHVPKNDPMLSLCSKPSTLDEEAVAAGFERGDDGAWLQPAGRFMRLPGWWMFGPRWDAIYSVRSVGIEDELGYHAAAGAEMDFIASDGRRTLLVSAPGPIDYSVEVLNTLHTLRFDAAPAAR